MLSVKDLTKRYPVRGTDKFVNALAGVSLTIEAGKTLGIVGESGCGKSTLAKVLVRLEDPTSGTISLAGADVTNVSGSELRSLRRRVQMVFQDPYSSLSPRLRVGDALAEILLVHKIGTPKGRPARVAELLEMVGLDKEIAERFPHEMSGGQRQRVGIARALAVDPEVLLLDEPVSALDVSVRAEIMNLLGRLRVELGLSYLFISHDVAMVRHLADQVAVMYLGRIVEVGDWDQVLDNAAHPYTQALSDAVPVPDPGEGQPLIATVTGEVPNPANPPAGCTFHPRCPLVQEICRKQEPMLLPLKDGRRIACHVVSARDQ